MKVGVGQAIAPTSIGTVNIVNSSAGFSSDVVAAVIFSSYATANDTLTADSSFSVGLVGKVGGVTTEASIGASGTDAVSTTVENSNNDATHAFIAVDRNSSSKVAIANCSAFITDGITLNFTTVNSRARRINALLVGGPNVEAKVLSFPFAADVNGASRSAAHGLSDTPIALIAISNRSSAVGGDSASQVSVWGGGVAAGMSFRSNDGNAAQACVMVGSATVWPIGGSAAADFLTPSVDATNVTLTLTLGSGSKTETWYVLAIYAPSMQAKAGSFTTPTVTGVDASISGLAFQPQGVLMIGSRLTSIGGAASTSDTADVIGIGAAASHSTVSQGSAAASADDGATPTLRKTWISIAKALRIPNTDGSDQVVAAVDTFDSGGLSLNYSAVNTGNAENVVYLAFAAPTTTGNGQPISGKFGGKLRGKLG